MIPYGRQNIDEDDIKAVCDVLRSNWLTTGPMVEKFEKKIAEIARVKFAAAVSSGTAALHAAIHALDIKPGDEIIVPPITFAATANAVVYEKGIPVFVDVNPDTLLIDPDKIEGKITSRTRAIIAVDYAGQLCNYDRLKKIAKDHNLYLIADSCHSIGGQYKGAASGSLADLSVFSFHPVKHITTGEGGMVVSDNEEFINRIKIFRNHGINADCYTRSRLSSWKYEISNLGYNYRLSDFQCALGISQAQKLKSWVQKRNYIADQYDKFFKDIDEIAPLKKEKDVSHAYHLYVIKLLPDNLISNREKIFSKLRQAGIGVNVHYIPVYYHPFYKENFNMGKGLCPIAEKAYEAILSIPLFPQITRDEIDMVCSTMVNIIKEY